MATVLGNNTNCIIDTDSETGFATARFFYQNKGKIGCILLLRTQKTIALGNRTVEITQETAISFIIGGKHFQHYFV